MIREILTGVVVITLLAGTAAVASDEPAHTPQWNTGSACEAYGFSDVSCESQQGFVQRLLNFRPWTSQSRCVRSIGTPGLPRGNRFYGPQYGNF